MKFPWLCVVLKKSQIVYLWPLCIIIYKAQSVSQLVMRRQVSRGPSKESLLCLTQKEAKFRRTRDWVSRWFSKIIFPIAISFFVQSKMTWARFFYFDFRRFRFLLSLPPCTFRPRVIYIYIYHCQKWTQNF